MIIDKLTIENYQCYFGIKVFEFSDGLNIILGENGEGKTKFFEAVNWLFEGNDDNLEQLVSKKTIENTNEGDTFRVRVSIAVRTPQDEKNIITKSFLVHKKNNDKIEISSYMLEGIEENKSGERSQVDGKNLLERIFPYQIRKYSMFKGEAELDIFKSEDALTNLINLFSDAKYFDKYSIKGAFLREKAEKAVEESSKTDKKNEQAYKKLEIDIQNLVRDKQGLKKRLELTEDEIKSLDSQIQDAGSYVRNATDLETINKRIKTIEDNISRLNNIVDENYTTFLFDENWIAVYFEKFHKEYTVKTSNLDHTRRKLQTDFDVQKGIKEGEKKAKAELLKNLVPLPVNVPSKAHMEEMLEDQLCKVCNREAKVGSEPYNFMMARLQEYVDSQINQPLNEDPNAPLFKCDYTNRLVYMSVAHEDNLKNLRNISSNIKELFQFNEERKTDIEEQQALLEKEINERAKILGNSNLAAEKLSTVLKDYNSWIADLKQRNREHSDLQTRLATLDADLKIKCDEKDKIDLNSAQLFLVKTRAILRDIETIFNDTKELKFTKFVEKLQDTSNQYFQKINVNSFTGNIVFLKRKSSTGKFIVDVELQENGQSFFAPNQSLLTSMHISVLFAISEIAKETREENYPMIFDAPTSSFGENKSTEFLNLIYETNNQKILLIKDFLVNDKSSKTLSIKTEFENIKRDKAFWLKLERPFDPLNLKTIETKIITL
jgi:DNA sulfur modification protein DndD